MKWDGCKARVLVAHRLENVGDRLFSGKEIRPKVRDHDPVRIIQTFEIVDLKTWDLTEIVEILSTIISPHRLRISHGCARP